MPPILALVSGLAENLAEGLIPRRVFEELEEPTIVPIHVNESRPVSKIIPASTLPDSIRAF
jgi:hypothetical protein